MGLYFSCPFWDDNDLEDSLESIVVKSISLGDDQVKTIKRTLSFKGQGLDEPKILKSLSSGKMVVEGSVSFKKRDNETTVSIISSPCTTENEKLLDRSLSKSSNINLEDDQSARSVSQSPALDPGSPKHKAALKLQKVYKSFRTRRKLADCAVLIEQSWWELLDFAELKHSSISFFDIEHHETAMSRWSRAKTRAAKVGKGLSKNEKAQKLALQHWLEAIDPRHRYGHNLHFYYVKWLQSHSREPFFYWLDIGEGKEVHLEKCPRAKLQQQCIKYLGPMERLAYEVCVEDGRMLYKQSGEVLDTGMDPQAKWIFVLSASKSLYVGKKKKGTFQHSSFLAGGATSAAGRLVVDNGTLKAVWPHSGHYRPTPENFQEFISFLTENNVDLSSVKMDPADDEEVSSIGTQTSSSLHWRNNSYEEDLGQENNGTNFEDVSEEKTSSTLVEKEEMNCEELVSDQKPKFRFSRRSSLNRKLTKIVIPGRDELCRKMQHENASSSSNFHKEEEEMSLLDDSEGNNKDVDVSDDDEATNEYDTIPEESILKRINSHKGTKSFQLGKQLSCKWTTGAGPRISCVRDYPSKLQFHALEQVSLSPRSIDCPRKSSAFTSNSWARLSQKGLMTTTAMPNCGEELKLPERTKSSPFTDLATFL